jgi:competence ComEA-like helix-hairpin-helix protein
MAPGAAGDAGRSGRGPRDMGARVPVRRGQLWLLWGVAAVLLVSIFLRWGWRAGWWAPQAKVVKGPPSEYRIDLNQAGEAELALLPGIGEVKAARIVAYRKEHGPFRSAEDLLAVEGVSRSLLSRLLPYVRLGPGARGQGDVPSSNGVSSSR